MDSDLTCSDTTEADFDAADLADAILAEAADPAIVPAASEPSPVEPRRFIWPAWSEAQRALFWLVLIALFLLLVGVGATSNQDQTESPELPRCDGDEVACCVESYGWNECCGGFGEPWRGDGLFDAEERFVRDDSWSERC